MARYKITNSKNFWEASDKKDNAPILSSKKEYTCRFIFNSDTSIMLNYSNHTFSKEVKF